MSPSPPPVTKNLATAPRYVSSRLLFLAELNFPSFQSSEHDQFPSVFLKKGLKACLHWKVYLAYPASLQALHSNPQKQIFPIQHNKIKNPNWQEATRWLFTSVTWGDRQYNAMQCNAMQCNAMQCNAMQCSAVQCNAIQYNTMQYRFIHDD